MVSLSSNSQLMLEVNLRPSKCPNDNSNLINGVAWRHSCLIRSRCDVENWPLQGQAWPPQRSIIKGLDDFFGPEFSLVITLAVKIASTMQVYNLTFVCTYLKDHRPWSTIKLGRPPY